jgi:hypothetical protein
MTPELLSYRAGPPETSVIVPQSDGLPKLL